LPDVLPLAKGKNTKQREKAIGRYLYKKFVKTVNLSSRRMEYMSRRVWGSRRRLCALGMKVCSNGGADMLFGTVAMKPFGDGPAGELQRDEKV
jgi:hypothetical protein